MLTRWEYRLFRMRKWYVSIHLQEQQESRSSYTAKDVDDWAIMFARCYETAGVTKKDRVHITPGYGLWTAGIGFQAGAEKLGAMVIPMGPGNTDKQLQMMIDLESTVLTATSSYALLLAEEID